MSDNSKIEWTDATVNAINGCSLASPGCTNCYAMRLAGTRMKNHPSREGLTIDTKAGPVWNGEVRLVESALLQPLRWRRPRAIFWNAHGDLFHPNVPDQWIDRQFAVMALTPQHKHLVLTKRSVRACEYVTEISGAWESDTPEFNDRFAHICTELTDAPCSIGAFEDEWPLPNVWLGVSVEDQDRAWERIPDLIATPARGRFLSCEPLLGPLDISRWLETGKIHGVIVGGESGPGARPMLPEWVRSLRDQCAAAGVDFHFKQWGEYAPYDRGHVDGAILATPYSFDYPLRQFGKKLAGRMLDGVTHDALPWTREIAA